MKKIPFTNNLQYLYVFTQLYITMLMFMEIFYKAVQQSNIIIKIENLIV